ncbi:MAG: PfkB family carbohydrate kinase [Methylophilus sp.]
MSNSVMILGEVLGDVFPEQTIIGGAPYNVARHCHAFGLDVHLLTAVGEDALGQRILDEMHTQGLSTKGVQQHPTLPTGQVHVHFEQHGHRFEILDNQAYDALDWLPVEALTEQYSPELIYFGTLALRHAPMQNVAGQWLTLCRSAMVFCDINLREPWYDKTNIALALQAANVLKINHEELSEVSRLLGLPGASDLHAQARQLLETFELSEMFVTCGEQGSFWLDENGSSFREAPVPLKAPFVDSVGAGDAYTAIVIRGLLANAPRQTMLADAAKFAAAICGVRGAVPDSAAFYKEYA